MKKEIKNTLCVIIFFILVIAIIVCSLVVKDNKEKEQYVTNASWEIYYVSPGDTLWNIAEICIYPSNQYDIGKVIFYIKQQNSLTSANLQIGQELLIPAYDTWE